MDSIHAVDEIARMRSVLRDAWVREGVCWRSGMSTEVPEDLVHGKPSPNECKSHLSIDACAGCAR